LRRCSACRYVHCRRRIACVDVLCEAELEGFVCGGWLGCAAWSGVGQEVRDLGCLFEMGCAEWFRTQMNKAEMRLSDRLVTAARVRFGDPDLPFLG
jgi:hypothetical protein